MRFAIDRAGLVGADGATHAGAFDVAYLAICRVYSHGSGDEAELVHMVATATAYVKGQFHFAIRAVMEPVLRSLKVKYWRLAKAA